MGYHLTQINRGEIGEFSKIEEEFLEAKDSLVQNNPIMLLLELSDLIGAIELYSLKHFNITLQDLLTMKSSTVRAFNDGTRKSR
jgi:hypothetical protein